MSLHPVGHSANDPEGTKLADFPEGIQYHCERGRALYRLGEPMPERAWDENGKELAVTDEQTYVFMGWLLERGKYLMKCKRVEDDLRPDPHDPRPPMAIAA